MTSALKKMPAANVIQHYQDGVALAILVWFLAAMSLLVAGIVMQARVDIKLAQLHATRARVEAAADGAIQLALAQLLQPAPEGELPQPVLQSQDVSVGSLNVTVNFTPVSGLIDINTAPEGLLFLLFSAVDNLDEAAAHELALNVVKWRSANPSGAGMTDQPALGSGPGGSGSGSQDAGSADLDTARHARFEAIEDLLLVTGFDRHIYQAAEDAVYVSQVEQSGVDWATAPAAVLRVLGGMDAESAQELVASRLSDQADALVAPEDLDLSFQEATQLSAYRVDAMVELDGSVFNRRRWVDRNRPGSDGLPWTFFRTEALRVVAPGAGPTTGDGVHAGS